MNNDDKSVEEFERQAKRALEFHERDLDPEILARLGAARRVAVAQIDTPKVGHTSFWAPAGAFAVTVLAVGTIWLSSGTQTPVLDESFQLAMEDRELLEDLEFVAWMVEQEEGYAG